MDEKSSSDFSMDLNTLMFIANQARLPTAQGQKQAPNLPLGPCYNCSGDHLIKDCPYPRQPRPNPANNVPALARYCLECGIKHLVSDCSLNLDKKGKATLNLLETIPSSNGNESKDVKFVKSSSIERCNTANKWQREVRKVFSKHLESMLSKENGC